MTTPPNPGDELTEEMFGHANGDLYCALMGVLKGRLDFVHHNYQMKVQGKLSAPTFFYFELCLLQLRYCCELLALGCIAMHTDVVQSSRLHKEWNASETMKVFTKLKPVFFPRAVQPDQFVLGSLAGFDEEFVPGALTKGEFLKAYHHFGKLLHAGVFEDFKTRRQRAYEWQEIEDFRVKLIKLLTVHIYEMYNGKKTVRIVMDNGHGTVRMSQKIILTG